MGVESRVYKTWVSSADDAETVARELEAHLNEYASEVIAVDYAVTTRHHVLAVYRAIDHRAEAALTVAERIIDEAQV